MPFLKTAKARCKPCCKRLSKKGQCKMQETLKAFIVSFELSDESQLKNVAIIAYTKKEAGDLFIAWATANKLYDKIVAIVVQRTKKTKRNKHMFTKDFYNKQKAHIDDMRKADA